MPGNWSQTRSEPEKAAARRAARQWSVLSTAELFECGFDKDSIRVRVGRVLHPLHWGVYAWGHKNIPVEGHWLAAVKACGCGAVLSHYAAACLHCLLKWDGRRIDVTASTKRTRPKIRTHRTENLERVVHRQIPVTPRLRTVTDLAKTEDEATVTRALRQARFSERELALLPQTGKLGRILQLSAAPTRSHPEDFVLDLVLKSGIEHPDVNQPQAANGRRTIPDLRWPEQRLIVEVDSREWHSDPLAQRDDADRQARLEADGWRVVRVTTTQAKQDPRLTIARLRAAGAPEAA